MTTTVCQLAMELTNRCNLLCPAHCYAQAGPARSDGRMSLADWKAVVDDAAKLGIGQLQLIGGEPSLASCFCELLEYAIQAGPAIEIYTNLTRVRPQWWPLYLHPNVSLATSYYADHADGPAGHDAVTGRRGSHAATRANIAEAVARSARIRVAIIDVLDGQRVEQARADLRSLGVKQIGFDHVRGVGNGARSGRHPTVADLCGACGRTQASVNPDGDVFPCVLSRWLTPAGNVRRTGLAQILGGPAMAGLVSMIAARDGEKDPCAPDKTDCKPKQDGGDCQPAEKPACKPKFDPPKK
jgi:MoaA/NifB/PqqE/SkfB family radical SAM enzyme